MESEVATEGFKSAVSKVELDPKKNTLPIKLLYDRVLLEQIPEQDTFLNGVLRPASVKNEERRDAVGKVVNVGDGTEEYPVFVEKDNIVHYFHGGAIELIFDGKYYHCIRSSDIFAIL